MRHHAPSGIRVLIVDDEWTIQAAYRRALKSLRPRWLVSTARSGREAMTVMDKDGFEVLITDIDMDGMDGIDLLRWTIATFPETHRVVVSGMIDGRTLVEVNLLAHAHLIKPVTMETLIERIEALIKPRQRDR